MISEGTILYYCLGATVPGFNMPENNVTVTLQDPIEIDDNVTSSSGTVESKYSESYTLTFECSISEEAALLLSIKKAIIASNIKQMRTHFKWLAKYHTAMCKSRNRFRHKNHWNRIRSRCWVSLHSVNPIVALVVILVLV